MDQLAKFEAKEYLFIQRQATEEGIIPIKRIFLYNVQSHFTRAWEIFKLIWKGHRVAFYRLKEPANMEVLFSVFGTQNKRPRQSLLGLFNKERLTLTVLEKDDFVTSFRLETKAEGKWVGVQVNLL